MAQSNSLRNDLVFASLAQADILVEHLPMDQEVHINHFNCPAGTDTRARLYLKAGISSLQWYCHHCQDGGRIRWENADKIKMELRETLDLDKPKVAEIPKTPTLVALTDPSVPESAIKYLAKVLPEIRVGDLRILYSQDPKGLAYPLPNGGWQVRLDTKQPRGPKYITFKGEPHPPPYKALGMTPMTECVVFTEDYISAYRIESVVFSAGIPLFGAHFSSRTFFEWYKTMNSQNLISIVVWLDTRQRQYPREG